MAQSRLSRIEVFAFNEPQAIHHGMIASESDRYGILKLTSHNEHSWGSCIITNNAKSFDLIKWATFLRSIRNCQLDEALTIVNCQSTVWEPDQLVMVQMALLDLSAKLQGKFHTGHIQLDRLHVAVAGGNSQGGRLYYRPSKSLSGLSLQKRNWPDWNTTELIDKSIAYFSIF